jgi:hypothetical protein
MSRAETKTKKEKGKENNDDESVSLLSDDENEDVDGDEEETSNASASSQVLRLQVPSVARIALGVDTSYDANEDNLYKLSVNYGGTLLSETSSNGIARAYYSSDSESDQAGLHYDVYNFDRMWHYATQKIRL